MSSRSTASLVPESQPKGGGVWYSCIKKAIMGYSLREDSKVPSKGDMVALKEELDEQLRYYQFIVSTLSHCEVPQRNYMAINQSDSCHRNSVDCKLQLYLPLWIWESGTETN